MARFRMRGRRRTRKRFMWGGLATTTTGLTVPVNGDILAIVLVDPSSEEENSVETIVERTLLDFWVYAAPNETYAEVTCGMYLHVVETDTAENIVGDQLWPPLSTDVDVLQKRCMWQKRLIVPFAGVSGGNGTMYLPNASGIVDIGVKRKLKGDQALVLAVQQDSDQSIVIQGTFRVLRSLGRR